MCPVQGAHILPPSVSWLHGRSAIDTGGTLRHVPGGNLGSVVLTHQDDNLVLVEGQILDVKSICTGTIRLQFYNNVCTYLLIWQLSPFTVGHGMPQIVHKLSTDPSHLLAIHRKRRPCSFLSHTARASLGHATGT